MKRSMLLGTLAILSFAHGASFTTKQYRETHVFGLKRDREQHFQFLNRMERHPKMAVQVPQSYDLTPKVSPPEDQGQCGSCWAFAITKGLRSASMLSTTDPGVLAFNYLLNNCGRVVNEDGCNGGDFAAGENMLNGLGPWLESQDPYTGQDGGRCLNLPPMDSAISYKAVGSPTQPPTFEELAQAISQNHMLIVDVAVCGQWENYSSGIYDRNECGERQINHMINMVGYDCETSVDSQSHCQFNDLGQPVNGDGYLKVMNNWGNSWGEDGYMRTRYGMDALATTAMFFEVGTTPPSPPGPPGPPTPPAPACRGFLCGLFHCKLPWCR